MGENLRWEAYDGELLHGADDVLLDKALAMQAAQMLGAGEGRSYSAYLVS